VSLPAKRVLWVVANALPLGVVLGSRGLGSPSASPVVAIVAFGALIGFVAAAQSIVIAEGAFRRRWFVATALGLLLGLAGAAIVLGAADMQGAEGIGIAAAHAVAGGALVLVQGRVTPRTAVAPGRWRWLGITASVVVSVALAAAVARGWHPGGELSRFAGYRELANFAVLLAGYGAGTAWSIVGRDPAG